MKLDLKKSTTPSFQGRGEVSDQKRLRSRTYRNNNIAALHGNDE